MTALTLRPYQQETLDGINAFIDRGGLRGIVVLPTASGKTVCFAQLPKIYGRTLVLVHREELLAQAKAKIQWANPNLVVEIERAGDYASLEAHVVVASVATLGRNNSPRILRFPADHFEVIVTDECHHATSDSYQRIFQHFHHALSIGFTATPQRGDKRGLFDVYDEVIYSKPIEEMIAEGWLAELRGIRIPTDVDISSVSTVAGDYAVGELSQTVNTPSRNRLIVEAYKRLLPGKRAAVFCVDVEHAKELAEEFRRAGVNAAEVVGTTDADVRRERLAAFSLGSLPVITNVGVLTEGYDEPLIEGIILARPMKSTLLYTQIVGRGLRTHPDKEYTLVIDMADAAKGKKPMGLPTLMGLPADFDLEGEQLTEVAEKFKRLEEVAPQEAVRVRTVQDIADAWERIDLFRPPPPDPFLQEVTQFIWMETGPDRYALTLGKETLQIDANALGRYVVSLRSSSKTRVLGSTDTMVEAFQRSDRWVRNNRRDNLKLLEADAVWRNEPPTPKQLKHLKKFDVPITSDLTKGAASIMLDRLFSQNPKPKRSAAQEYAIRAKQNRW